MPQRKPRKRKRPERATDGGSTVALSARLGRPGGTHGRRRKPRRIERERAIREDS